MDTRAEPFDLDEHVKDWEERMAGGATGHDSPRMNGVFLVYSTCDKPSLADRWVSDSWGVAPGACGSIMEQMEDDIGDWLGDLKEGGTWFRLRGWDGGETQYGTGYGDIYEIPGYWEYGRIDAAEAKRLIEHWHAQELDLLRSMSVDEFRAREEGLPPPCADNLAASSHRWVGEGDYGGGRRSTCGDCGIHIEVATYSGEERIICGVNADNAHAEALLWAKLRRAAVWRQEECDAKLVAEGSKFTNDDLRRLLELRCGVR